MEQNKMDFSLTASSINIQRKNLPNSTATMSPLLTPLQDSLDESGCSNSQYHEAWMYYHVGHYHKN